MVLIGEEEEFRVVFPPWEAALNGVVSLLQMLEFSARKYVELSYEFGLVIATFRDPKNAATPNLSEAIAKLLQDASALGLVVTQEHLRLMIEELTRENPGQFKHR